MVGHFQGGTIMIDYAHNEASLKNLLESLRAYHQTEFCVCLDVEETEVPCDGVRWGASAVN